MYIQYIYIFYYSTRSETVNVASMLDHQQKLHLSEGG